jgi:hypothetical protein
MTRKLRRYKPDESIPDNFNVQVSSYAGQVMQVPVMEVYLWTRSLTIFFTSASEYNGPRQTNGMKEFRQIKTSPPHLNILPSLLDESSKYQLT